MASHKCPTANCPARVSPAMLMCRPHWRMVPRPLQNAVYVAWDGGLGAGSTEHNAAIRAAIEAVNRKLAQP